MGRAGALCSCLCVCLVADYLVHVCAPVLDGHVSKGVCTSLCAPVCVLMHLRIARPRCVCACVGLYPYGSICVPVGLVGVWGREQVGGLRGEEVSLLLQYRV